MIDPALGITVERCISSTAGKDFMVGNCNGANVFPGLRKVWSSRPSALVKHDGTLKNLSWRREKMRTTEKVLYTALFLWVPPVIVRSVISWNIKDTEVRLSALKRYLCSFYFRKYIMKLIPALSPPKIHNLVPPLNRAMPMPMIPDTYPGWNSGGSVQLELPNLWYWHLSNFMLQTRNPSWYNIAHIWPPSMLVSRAGKVLLGAVRAGSSGNDMSSTFSTAVSRRRKWGPRKKRKYTIYIDILEGI